MPTRSLSVAITGDARSLNRVLDQTEGRTKRWGGAMTKGFALAGAAAGGALAGGLTKASKAAVEAEKSQARMTAQLRASGISYQAHAQQIDAVIQKHSKLAGIDDEDLQDAFTNIVRASGSLDVGLRRVGLAADIARAKHIDVAKAGDLVGKVAAGNTGILARYGIVIDKGATASEALGQLQQKFAGQAAAYGKTTAGALDRAQVASENLGEVVGAKLTPMLAKAANALVDVVEAVQEHWPKIRRTIGNVVDAVVGFVRRFRVRNREDIEAVVTAVRNLGRFFRNVFEDVILPAVRKALPAIKAALGGIIQAIRGLVRIVTGLINGDWSRVWTGVKDVVRGGLRASVNVIKALGGVIVDAAKGLGKAIIRGLVAALKGLGNAVKNAVVSEVKKGLDGALPLLANPIGGLGNKLLKGIGDGVGKAAGDGLGFMGGSAGGSGAGLMGADMDLGPFARIGAGMGLRVSSGLRPGSITSSGNKSYHSSGDAIDMAGSPGGMMRFFKTMRGMFGSRLRELIYTPGGVGIKDGRPFQYSGQVAADHYDHVHVAYTGPFGDGIGDMRNLWTRAGGRASAANMAAAIAMAESGGRRHPRDNINADGSVDRGPWQINSVHGALSTHDPLGNARAAVRISNNGRNWRPWATFNSGAYRAFLTSSGRGGGGRTVRARAMSPAEAFQQSQDNASDAAAAAGRDARHAAGRPLTFGELVAARGRRKSGAVGGTGDIGGGTDSGGGGENPDQPLIDALDASRRATEEHTAALNSVGSEMKRQTDLATSAMATDKAQLYKFVGDIMSGQIGRGIVGRSLTPGTGVEVAF